MSVIIKGMKMPKDKPLRIVLNPNGQLFVDHGITFTEYEAIELPDHGDLIDESEKVDAQYYDDELGEWSIKTKTVGEVLTEVCEVPPKIVIPAERSE